MTGVFQCMSFMREATSHQHTSVLKMCCFNMHNKTQLTTAERTHLMLFKDFQLLQVFYLPYADATNHCFLSLLVKITPLLQPSNETLFYCGKI